MFLIVLAMIVFEKFTKNTPENNNKDIRLIS